MQITPARGKFARIYVRESDSHLQLYQWNKLVPLIIFNLYAIFMILERPRIYPRHFYMRERFFFYIICGTFYL